MNTCFVYLIVYDEELDVETSTIDGVANNLVNLLILGELPAVLVFKTRKICLKNSPRSMFSFFINIVYKSAATPYRKHLFYRHLQASDISVHFAINLRSKWSSCQN